MLFESTLKSIGDSIDNFNITLEVDNIATIKDLVRKGLGVSILPQSACAREQKKGKMAVLPIENLSMMRETKIVYKKDFTHMDILQEITRVYHGKKLPIIDIFHCFIVLQIIKNSVQ